MADINLPMLYPKGVISGSLTGIEHLLFSRNFGCSSETVNVPASGNGVYSVAIDQKQIISGLYFIKAETVDGYTLRCILSANGKFSSYDGSDTYRNSVQLLSASGDDVIGIDELAIKASSTTDVSVIVKFKTNNDSNKPISVSITQVGSRLDIRPTADVSQYNIDLEATVTGVDRSVIVKTDETSEINLNDVDYNSIIYCNPASESSRPSKSGIGMCSTFIGMGKRFQIFWSEIGTMYIRSETFSWVEVSSANRFPKPVASGFMFAVSVDGNPIEITVDDIDLSDERYSIIVTPEYDIPSVAEQSLQIIERSDSSFKVKTQLNWAGVLSYSIVETRPSDDIPKINLTVGRLDGLDLRPATSVEEGQTIRFVLSSQFISDGTTIQYELSGVQEYDIGIPLTGSLTVKTSSAYLDVTILKDMLADGDKTIKMTLVDGTNASMFIKDTSTSPVFDIFFAKDRAGTQPVTVLKDGFSVYMIVKGIIYDKGVPYTIDFAGSSFQSAHIGSVPETIDVVFDDNDTFVYQFNFNQPESNEQVVTISADEVDLNLHTLARNKLGVIQDPSNIRFVINSGVTISSSSTINPAITIGEFPQGSNIRIINNGSIVGRGGRGGYAPTSLAQSLLDGEVGGACIDGSPNSFCVIENYGVIYSGGGGGGASGVCTESASTKYHPILSGGGGAPFGITPPIMGTSSLWMGDGYSDSISEYNASTNQLVRQWLSFNGEVFFRIGNEAPVLLNKHPIGDAKAFDPVVYNSSYRFEPCSPGNGGSRGLDGTDGYINSSTAKVVIAPGKGGKAGKVINLNEYNVVIRNISGIVVGH